MLNCREATQLVSEAQDRKLGPGERVGLAFHLLICALCRRYARQIDAITRALRSEGDKVMQDSARLDTAARERIRARLGR
jgi:Putative zinc-finger